MKLNYFLYAVIALVSISFLVNCGTSANPLNVYEKRTEEPDTLRIKNDSLDYEVVILDYGFNTWLVTQRPRGFYTQRYMEIRNIQYVNEYNNRVSNPNRYKDELYPFPIEYNFKTNYGYEVNYLLYHYFLFFEEKYNQKLR